MKIEKLEKGNLDKASGGYYSRSYGCNLDLSYDEYNYLLDKGYGSLTTVESNGNHLLEGGILYESTDHKNIAKMEKVVEDLKKGGFESESVIRYYEPEKYANNYVIMKCKREGL